MGIVLHTNDFPDVDPVEVWRQKVSDFVVPLDLVPAPDQPFSAGMHGDSVDGMHMLQMTASSLTCHRTPQGISRHEGGSYKVLVPCRGRVLVSQRGRQAVVRPGDLVLYDTARPYTAVFESTSAVVLVFPRDLLQFQGADLDRLTAVTMSGESGLGNVTSVFLQALGKQVRDCPPATSRVLARNSIDLLGALFAEQSDVDQPVPQRALVLQLKAYLDGHLRDPELSAATVAAAHYISPRYVQKLFAAEGTTVGEWVRSRRLRHCYDELTSPSAAALTVSAIAAAWGFSDSAHFSRLFRAAYGMSPRECRSTGGLGRLGQPALR